MGWPHCDDRHFQTLRSALRSLPKASSCYSVPTLQQLTHTFQFQPLSCILTCSFPLPVQHFTRMLHHHLPRPLSEDTTHHLPSSPTWLFWESTLSAQINFLLTDWCIDCLELCLLHKICHPDVLALSICLLASFLKSISLVSGSLHSDSSWTWKLKVLLLTSFHSWLPELSYQRTSKKHF